MRSHSKVKESVPGIAWDKSKVFRRILFRIEESEKDRQGEDVEVASSLTGKISSGLAQQPRKN